MELTPLPPQSPLAPTEQEVALLTTQYRKAVNGLYEAYRFGQMLLRVRERLEALTQRTADSGQRTAAFRDGSAEGPEGDPQASPENQGFSRGAARGTAREVTVGANGNAITPGWNAGTGLKGWLGVYCPEINYSTARRFLSVAEKTHAALGSGDSPVDCSLSTVDSAAEPSEQAVRDFLEGKSQRQVLRRGGAREGAGRKAKDYAAALDANGEVAWREIEEPLAALSELIVSQRRHTRLSAADLETLRAAIDLLHERVHADA